MIAVINGEKTEINPDTTVISFIRECGINPLSVVVEYNQKILPRSSWENNINDGDNIEIIRMIGGG